MNKMHSGSAVSGSLAECYVTLEGRRYQFMQLYKFESKWTVNMGEIPILGRVGKGHKPAGSSGEWSGTAHYNQSIMRKLLLQYKNTGEMPYFDIQVTNEDPSSKIGRQTVIHRDCLINGGILAKYDATSDFLDEEISGTFDDWDLPEAFANLSGME